jgi:hypothetical protein
LIVIELVPGVVTVPYQISVSELSPVPAPRTAADSTQETPPPVTEFTWSRWFLLWAIKTKRSPAWVVVTEKWLGSYDPAAVQVPPLPTVPGYRAEHWKLPLVVIVSPVLAWNRTSVEAVGPIGLTRSAGAWAVVTP